MRGEGSNIPEQKFKPIITEGIVEADALQCSAGLLTVEHILQTLSYLKRETFPQYTVNCTASSS